MDLETISILSPFIGGSLLGIGLAYFMLCKGFPYMDEKVGNYLLDRAASKGISVSRGSNFEPVSYEE